MKEANLLSIISAFESLSQEAFNSYLKYHSIQIKFEELKDLKVLVDQLRQLSIKTTIFDKYFVGYNIPQIGKEFDLLRLDEDSIVNIEIKKRSTPEKIKAQLERNVYYLSFLKKEIYSFTYVADTRKLYTLDKQTLIETDLRQLLAILVSQNVTKIIDIDRYFVPSNYLVSPFNSTQQFIKGRYFLTAQQEEIKNMILPQIDTPEYSIISIVGKAGTGKTLLTYDIAKQVLSKSNTLLIHCGLLNEGHNTLRDDYGWNIIPAKYLMRQDFSTFRLVVIDEAQRIYKNQLDHVLTEVRKFSSNCILSYDGQQTLQRGEIQNDIRGKIEKEATAKPFELTTKIRTNKEVASFIKALFDKNIAAEKYPYSSIELNYFQDYEEAQFFLRQLKSEGWKTINYTPSTVSTLPYEKHKIDGEFDNAHTVIGQEFDKVVAVIDEHFYYKQGTLSTRAYKKRPYYHPTKMLFQIVSRTRLRLHVVIIRNEEILTRCLNILDI